MDTKSLVRSSQTLLDALGKQVSIARAAWLHDEDRGWNLYIVPREDSASVPDFYQRIVKVLKKNDDLTDLNISNIDVLYRTSRLAADLQNYEFRTNNGSLEQGGIFLGAQYFDRAIILQ